MAHIFFFSQEKWQYCSSIVLSYERKKRNYLRRLFDNCAEDKWQTWMRIYACWLCRISFYDLTNCTSFGAVVPSAGLRCSYQTVGGKIAHINKSGKGERVIWLVFALSLFFFLLNFLWGARRHESHTPARISLKLKHGVKIMTCLQVKNREIKEPICFFPSRSFHTSLVVAFPAFAHTPECSRTLKNCHWEHNLLLLFLFVYLFFLPSLSTMAWLMTTCEGPDRILCHV